MINYLNKYAIKIHKNAVDDNLSNILDFIESNKNIKLLDLGCNDGAITTKISNKLSMPTIYGVDIVGERLKIAKELNIEVIKSDLNGGFPFKSNSFDVIHANQVIEHLSDVDRFATEIYRVLKPGRYAIISTENLSSWHNIFALLLGWQAFSQNISTHKRIGIPNKLDFSSDNSMPSWLHIKIFTYFGLKSFFNMHGFKVEQIKSAGYYPFPPQVSNALSKLDPVHTHFITIKVMKKVE